MSFGLKLARHPIGEFDEEVQDMQQTASKFFKTIIRCCPGSISHTFHLWSDSLKHERARKQDISSVD